MIKVAIYEYECDWYNDKPSKIVTLKEFEEMFGDGFRPFLLESLYRIKFIDE